jgi:tetratricopeptide (TPR) repeat protein
MRNASSLLRWLKGALASSGSGRSEATEQGERMIRDACARQDAGDLSGASELFRKMLQKDPEHSGSLHRLGAIEAQLGHDQEAAGLLQRAIAIDDSSPASRYILGCLLQSAGSNEAAGDSYRRALALDSAYAPAHLNLGVICQQSGDTEAALSHFRAATAAAPADPYAWINLGYALERSRRLNEARAAYDRALEIDPANVGATFDRSMVLLALGEYETGWRDYDYRWQATGYPRPAYSQPEWDGSSLAGQTLLLYTEQGYGDAVQFARYATLAAQRGARVVLRCPRELHELLGTIAGVTRIIAPDEAVPFDLHASLLSLPRLFRTTAASIPAATSYIRADPARTSAWEERIGPGGGTLNVGLVWASQSKMPNAAQKSMRLRDLAALGEVPKVRFFSLQVGEAGRDAASSPPFPVADLTGEIRGFADTAAIIASLDLVISVDTAVAHVAGALGARVWTMLQYAPDWRWYPDASTTAWYPQMRLYRQPAPGDWASVCERVARDLARTAAGATFPT